MTKETKAVRALMEKCVAAGKGWRLYDGGVRGTRTRDQRYCCPLGALGGDKGLPMTVEGYPTEITTRVHRAADNWPVFAGDRSYLLSLCGHPGDPFRKEMAVEDGEDR